MAEKAPLSYSESLQNIAEKTFIAACKPSAIKDNSENKKIERRNPAPSMITGKAGRNDRGAIGIFIWLKNWYEYNAP